MAESAKEMPIGMSVKRAAEIMNVSERSVYMARAVMRLRPDLVPAIEAGPFGESVARGHPGRPSTVVKNG